VATVEMADLVETEAKADLVEMVDLEVMEDWAEAVDLVEMVDLEVMEDWAEAVDLVAVVDWAD
jgi:hypothetical protein